MRRTPLLVLVTAFLASGAVTAQNTTGPATRTAAQTFADHPVNVWVKQSPRPDASSPRFGWEAAGVYDTYLGKWLHWGGHDGNPQGFAMFHWDPVTSIWQQLFPADSPEGVCCVDGAQTFDLANRRFVRFPGATLGHGMQWSRSAHLRNSAVWLYDAAGNSWTNMRPAPYKAPPKYSKETIGALNACGAYDEVHELALSFSGQNSAGGTNNLFAYDAYANDFNRFNGKNPPARRDGGGFCYDSVNDCAVVWGSQYLDDPKVYLYRYATDAWEAHDIQPAPPTRKVGPYSTIPKLAYDSRNGICLCVVWLGEKEGHETWALDVKKLAWTKLSPAVEPSPSRSRTRNISYDRDLNVFILETWSVNSVPEIWTYRYKAAAPDPAPAPPTDLTCLTSADAKVNLTWKPSVGAVKYDIYRAQAAKPWLTTFEKVATSAEPTWQDTPPADKEKVTFYKVRAVNAAGVQSRDSHSARTQPRVPQPPLVSVLAANRIEISWPASLASDVVGYNVYRGLVIPNTSTTFQKSHGANNPDYPEPVMEAVQDITPIEKLNDKPVAELKFTDDKVDLAARGPQAGDYKYNVYAYIIRAVNQWGVESGPSAYTLTIPSAPRHVLLREKGRDAEIKWEPNREQGIAGYRVYEYGKQMALLTPELLKQTTFTHQMKAANSQTRFSVVAVDALGQEGVPSTMVWFGHAYKGFFEGDWHQ